MPYKIVVVDDDPSMIAAIRNILISADMKAVPMTSGKVLLDFIEVQSADLILLDVVMPEMDGFETLTALREKEKRLGKKEIPVIFLTAEDNRFIETKALELGAMDFIKKPFVPEILTLRVTRCIELITLQNELTTEVKKKTKENEQLFLGIVKSLAAAIDAKDTYTNGHSVRVAEYSREIARRAGYDDDMQQRIYITGLLHDVGKIGVPDAIINKEGKLDDAEYGIIKMHPEKGSRILKNIKEMPELTIGARWHHERYDGKGYPEGLAGDKIPEEARIIAVADSYDAMTSNRSYRRGMPQEKVRSEIEKGKGSQFDPFFADIMLQMIDEDTNYEMREKDNEERLQI
ncbi:MAG: response regulator [Butyrivibrio sp.]|uniref:HD domain-containing phosphohydrolase n=1 Tax=Butyrivibrio sp. TaxID=28121 RepID=UPI001B192D00|nr:HD domain-containing phosphohydrolase [Butyrivibrio sp.]MBO6240826.1 response regulator [Butyrivibrio sp.]